MFTTGWREILREVNTSTRVSCGAKWGGAGAGVGDEKCSTSVSMCADLRRSMETVSVRPLISIVNVCLFFVRLDKVHRMAVEVTSAGHCVVQQHVLPLLNF